MDHELVAAQKMTERYFLNELDSAARDEFEEHYFNCPECAAEVHAAALLVEEIAHGAIPNSEPLPTPILASRSWFAGLRPAFMVPVMATLLGVVGYQNLVTYPRLARQLGRPQILPWAPVNLDTYAPEGPTITAQPGQAFTLLVRIPPGGVYSKYIADLYNPTDKPDWSFAFTISPSNQDQFSLLVPGANREAGRYKLKVRGITSSGESQPVGETSFELQIQK
jgi:hypothetical protein